MSTVNISDSYFSANGFEGALRLETGEEGESWVAVTGSEFVDNLSDFAAVSVSNSVESVYVADNLFTGNDTTGGGGEGGGLLIDASSASSDAALGRAAALAAAPPEGLLEGAVLVAGNVFENNASSSGAAGVHISNFLQSPTDTAVFLRSNAFSGNASEFDAADFATGAVGDSEEGRAELAIEGNTFETAPGEESGEADAGPRSVEIPYIAGGAVRAINNTFSGPEAERPLLGVDAIEEGGTFDLVHNTFSGGGAALGQHLELEPDSVSLTATVFDTGADPVLTAEGGAPMTIADVVTRTASENLPGIAATPQEDINLGELADNGGLTRTMLPGEGSKLIDAISEGTVHAAVDQRGIARPQGPKSDVGAVEVEAVAPIDPDVIALEKDITVVEGEDAVITALRTGLSGGAASATVTAEDGSAVFETDYSLRGDVVSFAAVADTADQRTTLAFPTVARDGKQGDRTFTVTLSAPSEGAVLGEPQTVTVTIIDADEAGPGPVKPKPDGDDELSVTGSSPSGWLLWATALAIVLGAGVLARQWVAKRR